MNWFKNLYSLLIVTDIEFHIVDKTRDENAIIFDTKVLN